MRANEATNNAVGLVCDTTGTTVYVACGAQNARSLSARLHVDYTPEELGQRRPLPQLATFVRENKLSGCTARLVLAGAGTVVQALKLPPMRPRHRAAAMRTRLTSYAAGRELIIGTCDRSQRGNPDAGAVLAAGVDERLVLGLLRACRTAGLRVHGVTALASAVAAPDESELLAQVVLGERTTTIQFFDTGQLVTSRDVLLGRNDLVAAYQRPILGGAAPLNLNAAEAELLLNEVGVPFERDDEIRPGVAATQLWPLVTPVLQKLSNEIGQTIRHAAAGDRRRVVLRALSLPVVPGLAEQVGLDLNLRVEAEGRDRLGHAFLEALTSDRPPALDLRPAPERQAERLMKPAFGAAACAALVMLANTVTPRQASGRIDELRPVMQTTRTQLEQTRAQLAAVSAQCAELAERVQRRATLVEAAPLVVPVRGPLKSAFERLPPGVTLHEVRLRADQPPATLELQGIYRGELSAGIAAVQWARGMTESAFFTTAEVTSVRDGAIGMIELRAEVR